MKLDVQFPTGGRGGLPARVSVDLTLAVGMTGWPGRSDFPDRVPLASVDALMAHRAASKVGDLRSSAETLADGCLLSLTTGKVG